jgi:hypothetical protein
MDMAGYLHGKIQKLKKAKRAYRIFTNSISAMFFINGSFPTELRVESKIEWIIKIIRFSDVQFNKFFRKTERKRNFGN